MVTLFKLNQTIFAVDHIAALDSETIEKLSWLFSGAELIPFDSIEGTFVGPRREMITPWSTNAVEITQNMGIEGIKRIEEFYVTGENPSYDKMLLREYSTIDQQVFTITHTPEPIEYIDDIRSYNAAHGLALVEQEIEYLEAVSRKVGRSLSDSEVFGFSQVNSEHCRHKIFNGQFIIDGVEMQSTLFGMIRKTTNTHQGAVVSAYTDNCAFLAGPHAEQFAPATHATADFYQVEDYDSVISIKAETHNFPTTVEPFNGAATGTGGEIRDRVAGGKGAFPMTGTAVYMTAYPRLDGGREWESKMGERKWLYQTPEDILIKASNGASDFGNKFGQPLICGSLYTFEHQENGKNFGFDKVIMLAGGIGYGKKVDCLKDEPSKGDKVVLLGGDNYRIGMGGGAVSSVDTGEFAGAIELNAIQRSNPEMQKRAYNAVRAIAEESNNPIISIHDHGAGGHLNCLSELVEATGGRIDIDQLPIGDPTLSYKEIVGNESQERIGLVIKEEHIENFQKIAERERCPFYVIGETTGDMQFTFVDNKTGEKPIDLQLDDMFGKTPRSVLTDRTVVENYAGVTYSEDQLSKYITNVLQIEGVACKDWLTNKVDRSVTGKVALQQCAGAVQLPLNDCGVFAVDYQGTGGVANSLGAAPAVAMVDAAKGSVMAIAESLTNLVFAPIQGGLGNVSLSANWMWPCKNEGEDARLYKAVESASDFAIALGLNIPTGKDSLSMTQKYSDGSKVYAPGTVIITAAGEVSDIKKCVKAALVEKPSDLLYIDFTGDHNFPLAGSAFAQTQNAVGDDAPTVACADYFKKAWEAVQMVINHDKVLSGHDVSGGGLITALLEMTFSGVATGLNVDLNTLREADLVKLLFSEKPAVLLQVEDAGEIITWLDQMGVSAQKVADVNLDRTFTLVHGCCQKMALDINSLRDVWYKTSYLLDRNQSTPALALERYNNYKKQPLQYIFPTGFTGQLSSYGLDGKRRMASGIKAAVIREKGCQCEREIAWNMYLAGFDVKDVHMTDLISGRETLEDVNMIAFSGGFSNSDVMGSAKGWAGAFLYNPKAKEALEKFYAREDTLSVGICNGCQLMVELGLLSEKEEEGKPKMAHNNSHKFESNFVGVNIEQSSSIMLKSLEGSSLGIWVAHGEGKFILPKAESEYNVALKYSYAQYPANPNGSDYNVAGICSKDGRHLAMMPHFERSLRPWNWAFYPSDRCSDEVSPWIEAFVNAFNWIKNR
ncbi:MAG: phosphoribosylformylglycinamidine synthase [Rikenellaceae bacterium]